MPPLSPERWRAVGPYLDHALDIAPEDRAALLAFVQSQDEVLAADLRALLAEHEALHESHFLERSISLPPQAGRPR